MGTKEMQTFFSGGEEAEAEQVEEPATEQAEPEQQPDPVELKATESEADQDEDSEDSRDSQEDSRDDTTVSLKALKEERWRRQQLQKEMQELRQQRERDREQQEQRERAFQEFLKRFDQKDQPAEPDYYEDPKAFIEAKMRQIDERVTKYDQQTEQQKRQQVELQQRQQLASAVTQAEQAFSQQHPDYGEVVGAAIEARQAALTNFGFEPQEVAETIGSEIAFLTSKALRAGRDPAEALYEMAQPYRKQKPQNGQKPPPQMPTGSLGRAGGKPPKHDMSLEAIAAIDDPAEFDKAFNQFYKPSRKSNLPIR